MNKFVITTLIGFGLIVITGIWSCKNSKSGGDPEQYRFTQRPATTGSSR
ncbi:MAG: hypothetical protein ABIJ04_08480 [Bacteroidota bacterium]